MAALVRHSSPAWGDRAARKPRSQQRTWWLGGGSPRAQYPSPCSGAHLKEGLPLSEGFPTPTAQTEREILWGLLKTNDRSGGACPLTRVGKGTQEILFLNHWEVLRVGLLETLWGCSWGWDLIGR